MLKLIFSAAVAFGLLFSLPASAQSVQYVGNSKGPGTNPRSGGAGLLELNDECVATFGDGARMCSSLEILQTLQTDTLPVRDTGSNSRKWVAPAIVAGSSNAIDATGIAGTAAQLSCNGWSSQASTSKGLTIDQDGRFTTQPCNAPRQIACCKAAP
jgi:hypothetical protein